MVRTYKVFCIWLVACCAPVLADPGAMAGAGATLDELNQRAREANEAAREANSEAVKENAKYENMIAQENGSDKAIAKQQEKAHDAASAQRKAREAADAASSAAQAARAAWEEANAELNRVRSRAAYQDSLDPCERAANSAWRRAYKDRARANNEANKADDYQRHADRAMDALDDAVAAHARAAPEAKADAAKAVAEAAKKAKSARKSAKNKAREAERLAKKAARSERKADQAAEKAKEACTPPDKTPKDSAAASSDTPTPITDTPVTEIVLDPAHRTLIYLPPGQDPQAFMDTFGLQGGSVLQIPTGLEGTGIGSVVSYPQTDLSTGDLDGACAAADCERNRCQEYLLPEDEGMSPGDIEDIEYSAEDLEYEAQLRELNSAPDGFPAGDAVGSDWDVIAGVGWVSVRQPVSGLPPVSPAPPTDPDSPGDSPDSGGGTPPDDDSPTGGGTPPPSGGGTPTGSTGTSGNPLGPDAPVIETTDYSHDNPTRRSRNCPEMGFDNLARCQQNCADFPQASCVASAIAENGEQCYACPAYEQQLATEQFGEDLYSSPTSGIYETPEPFDPTGSLTFDADDYLTTDEDETFQPDPPGDGNEVAEIVEEVVEDPTGGPVDGPQGPAETTQPSPTATSGTGQGQTQDPQQTTGEDTPVLGPEETELINNIQLAEPGSSQRIDHFIEYAEYQITQAETAISHLPQGTPGLGYAYTTRDHYEILLEQALFHQFAAAPPGSLEQYQRAATFYEFKINQGSNNGLGGRDGSPADAYINTFEVLLNEALEQIEQITNGTQDPPAAPVDNGQQTEEDDGDETAPPVRRISKKFKVRTGDGKPLVRTKLATFPPSPGVEAVVDNNPHNDPEWDAGGLVTTETDAAGEVTLEVDQPAVPLTPESAGICVGAACGLPILNELLQQAAEDAARDAARIDKDINAIGQQINLLDRYLDKLDPRYQDQADLYARTLMMREGLRGVVQQLAIDRTQLTGEPTAVSVPTYFEVQGAQLEAALRLDQRLAGLAQNIKGDLGYGNRDVLEHYEGTVADLLAMPAAEKAAFLRNLGVDGGPMDQLHKANKTYQQTLAYNRPTYRTQHQNLLKQGSVAAANQSPYGRYLAAKQKYETLVADNPLAAIKHDGRNIYDFREFVDAGLSDKLLAGRFDEWFEPLRRESRATIKGLLLVNEIFRKQLLQYLLKLKDVQQLSDDERLDLARSLEKRARVAAEAYRNMVGAQSDMARWEGLSVRNNAKSRYESLLKLGRTGDANRSVYAVYERLKKAYISIIDETPLLGLTKGNTQFWDGIANDPTDRPFMSGRSDKALLEMFDDYLAETIQDVRALEAKSHPSTLKELVTYGSGKYLRQQQMAALQSAYAGELVQQAQYAGGKEQADAEFYRTLKVTGLSVVVGGISFVPVVGPYLSLAGSLVLAKMEGGELYVLYVQEMDAKAATEVIGVEHVLSTSDKRLAKTYSTGLALGGVVFDAANITRVRHLQVKSARTSLPAVVSHVDDLPTDVARSQTIQFLTPAEQVELLAQFEPAKRARILARLSPEAQAAYIRAGGKPPVELTVPMAKPAVDLPDVIQFEQLTRQQQFALLDQLPAGQRTKLLSSVSPDVRDAYIEHAAELAIPDNHQSYWGWDKHGNALLTPEGEKLVVGSDYRAPEELRRWAPLPKGGYSDHLTPADIQRLVGTSNPTREEIMQIGDLMRTGRWPEKGTQMDMDAALALDVSARRRWVNAGLRERISDPTLENSPQFKDFKLADEDQVADALFGADNSDLLKQLEKFAGAPAADTPVVNPLMQAIELPPLPPAPAPLPMLTLPKPPAPLPVLDLPKAPLPLPELPGGKVPARQPFIQFPDGRTFPVVFEE